MMDGVLSMWSGVGVVVMCWLAVRRMVRRGMVLSAWSWRRKRLISGGVFVVEEGDVFCALEEAVEVVGVDGYAMACGGEVEACA